MPIQKAESRLSRERNGKIKLKQCFSIKAVDTAVQFGHYLTVTYGFGTLSSSHDQSSYDG